MSISGCQGAILARNTAKVAFSAHLDHIRMSKKANLLKAGTNLWVIVTKGKVSPHCPTCSYGNSCHGYPQSRPIYMGAAVAILSHFVT